MVHEYTSSLLYRNTSKGGGGEMGEGGQKVQTSNYKIDTFWGYNNSVVTIILTVLYCIFENG